MELSTASRASTSGEVHKSSQLDNELIEDQLNRLRAPPPYQPVVLKWTLLPDLQLFSYTHITHSYYPQHAGLHVLGITTGCLLRLCAVPWPSKLTLLPHPQFVSHTQIVPYMYLEIPQDVYWSFSSTLHLWHHFQSQSCSIKPKWAWHMYNNIIFEHTNLFKFWIRSLKWSFSSETNSFSPSFSSFVCMSTKHEFWHDSHFEMKCTVFHGNVLTGDSPTPS